MFLYLHVSLRGFMDSCSEIEPLFEVGPGPDLVVVFVCLSLGFRV